MRVQSLGREDPLEEGIVTHCSISCLENPMDKGVWRATVHGVAKSRTWLKWLSMLLCAWIVPGGRTCFWASSRNFLLLCLSSYLQVGYHPPQPTASETGPENYVPSESKAAVLTWGSASHGDRGGTEATPGERVGWERWTGSPDRLQGDFSRLPPVQMMLRLPAWGDSPWESSLEGSQPPTMALPCQVSGKVGEQPGLAEVPAWDWRGLTSLAQGQHREERTAGSCGVGNSKLPRHRGRFSAA